MAIDIRAYYEKYGPMVLRRCRFMLKDEERARDAMHDVFVKLIKKEDELKDQYPSSLLYRIATNTCLNIIRSRSRRPETVVEERLLAIANYEEPESSWHARDFLARLFGGEKESTRTIAVLHYLDGMTLQEVSKQAGMSVSGVRKRLRNLRKHVHELEEADNV